jgi:hypothetical protein
MMWIVALPSCSDDSDRQKKVASKPLVVAVRGACFAGGLELALNGDAIVAAQETLFRQPEVARGIFAFGGGEAADRHYRVEAAGVNGTSSRCLRSVLIFSDACGRGGNRREQKNTTHFQMELFQMPARTWWGIGGGKKHRGRLFAKGHLWPRGTASFAEPLPKRCGLPRPGQSDFGRIDISTVKDTLGDG